MGLLMGVVFLVLWVMAGSMASPERRGLQDYHGSYLDEMENYGLMIKRRDFADGKVPYLTVRPDGDAGVAKRGGLLRKQLEDRGQVLPEFGKEIGLLVLLHGRNGRKEDLLPVAERFCAVGFVCVIPDLPAHGESAVETVGFGAREFERELAGRVAGEARVALGLGEMPEFLWGLSMGGSFAVHAAAKESKRWERMIIVASFDRLDGVVGDSLGWSSGLLKPVAGWFIEARDGPEIGEVEPVELAKGLRLPGLVIHGNEDDLISIERGRELYDAFAGEKAFLTVPGGNHDNVLVTEAPVYAAMAGWFLDALK